jgi:hypothetical protein
VRTSKGELVIPKILRIGILITDLKNKLIPLLGIKILGGKKKGENRTLL